MCYNKKPHYNSTIDIDKSLNDDTTEKIREYRVDYHSSNRPSNCISFRSVVDTTSGLLNCDLVCILF
jgi:hypothetical protein